MYYIVLYITRIKISIFRLFETLTYSFEGLTFILGTYLMSFIYLIVICHSYVIVALL